MTEALISIFRFESHRFKKSVYFWLFILSLVSIFILMIMLFTKKALEIPLFNREDLMLSYQDEIIRLRALLESYSLSNEQLKSITMRINELDFYLKSNTCEYDYIFATNILARNPLYESTFFSFNFLTFYFIFAFMFIPLYSTSVIYANSGISSKNVLMSKFSRKELLLGKYAYLLFFCGCIAFFFFTLGLIILPFTDMPQILIYLFGRYYALDVVIVYISLFIAVSIISILLVFLTNLMSFILNNFYYGLVLSICIVLTLLIIFLFTANAIPNMESIAGANDVAMYIPIISLLYFGFTGFSLEFFVSLFTHLLIIVFLFLPIYRNYLKRGY